MKLELARITAGIALTAMLVACGKETQESAAPVSTAPAPAPSPAVEAPAPASVPSVEPWPASGHCILDTINGTPAASWTVDRSEEATFAGWMANGAGQVPTDALLVLSDASGRHEFPLRGGIARPDVAQAMGKDSLQDSGYNTAIDLSDVPPGTYALAIEMGDPGTACALGPTLTVTD